MPVGPFSQRAGVSESSTLLPTQWGGLGMFDFLVCSTDLKIFNFLLYFLLCDQYSTWDLKPGRQLWSSFCTCYTSEIWRRGGGRVCSSWNENPARYISGDHFQPTRPDNLFWNAFMVLIII